MRRSSKIWDDRFRITSIIIALVMIVSSLGIMLTIPSTTVSAFPTSDPLLSEYLFYDDFETDLLNWTVTGGAFDPIISTTHAFTGAHSLRFNGTNVQVINRSFGIQNENICIEMEFYDDATDLDAIAELWAQNATGEARLGVLTSSSQNQFIGVDYEGNSFLLNCLRSTGWTNLKMSIVTDRVKLYINDEFLGETRLTDATGYAFIVHSGGPLVCWIDSFIIYSLWQDDIWARPVSSTQSSDYWFFDGFESDLLNWTLSGGMDPTIVTTPIFNGAHSLFLNESNGTQQISRPFGNLKDNMSIELEFYDNSSDTSAIAEFLVTNATGNVNFGVRTATSVNYLEYRSYAGVGTITSYARGSGWVNLKMLTANDVVKFYANGTYLGSTSLHEPTGYAFLMHTAGSISCYLDEFIVYPTPCINLNKTWSAETIAEPNVIYEGGIWKMWYRGSAGALSYANGLGYATSIDGLVWTEYASNPVTSIEKWCPTVHKIGATYYLYYSSDSPGNWTIMQKTSSDGIIWSLANATNLRNGTSGAWDDWLIGNNDFWYQNGQWHMLYDATNYSGMRWQDGYATSPDGLVWTKYGTAPVITGGTCRGGPDVYILDGVYYCFLIYGDVSALPSDIALYQSIDAINWAPSTFTIQLPRDPARYFENQQVADPFVIEVNGISYLYFCGSSNGVDGRIFVARSSYTLSQIVNGEILQWGEQLIGDIGVTNDVAVGGVYWYSGINAMKGTYFHDLSLTTTSDVNLTITSRSASVFIWTADPGDGNPTVTFTLSGLESGVGYKVYVDGVLYYQQLKGLADLTFTYSGPWSEHTFEVVAWDMGNPDVTLDASFSYSIDGNLVSFTDKSYGGAVVWIWNFGDGSGSTKQSPTHTYKASGKYIVSLTVYDSGGHSSKASVEIILALGPNFPVERNPSGWDIFITDDLTVSVSAVGLLVGGAIMFVSAIFLPSVPFITPKGRKLIGALMVLAGLYFLIFVDNSWMKF